MASDAAYGLRILIEAEARGPCLAGYEGGKGETLTALRLKKTVSAPPRCWTRSAWG
jgi:hypothetical protein